MWQFQELRDFLADWKEASADDLSLDFPTREQFEECAGVQCDGLGWETAMLHMLDEGIVGMDGFKYCWSEVAKENRRRVLASQRRQSCAD